MNVPNDPVVVTRHGALVTITLNRPTARNALDSPLKKALRVAVEEAAADETVRSVILTGAGGHFCAGQDLKEHARALEERGAHALDTVVDEYAPVVTALATMPKPVVAAVEGNCVGAGLALALACDLRVLSRTATLATAFSAIGLTTDSGLAHTLPRAVGDARARELVLLAEPFTAEQAVGWGIAARLTEPGAVLEEATTLASRLAAGPTAAYAESKTLLDASWSRGLVETMAAEGDAQVRLGATRDHHDAVHAFLAKERPTFTGR